MTGVWKSHSQIGTGSGILGQFGGESASKHVLLSGEFEKVNGQWVIYGKDDQRWREEKLTGGKERKRSVTTVESEVSKLCILLSYSWHYF